MVIIVTMKEERKLYPFLATYAIILVVGGYVASWTGNNFEWAVMRYGRILFNFEVYDVLFR